jgi:hypothetical protein
MVADSIHNPSTAPLLYITVLRGPSSTPAVTVSLISYACYVRSLANVYTIIPTDNRVMAMHQISSKEAPRDPFFPDFLYTLQRNACILLRLGHG